MKNSSNGPLASATSLIRYCVTTLPRLRVMRLCLLLVLFCSGCGTLQEAKTQLGGRAATLFKAGEFSAGVVYGFADAGYELVSDSAKIAKYGLTNVATLIAHPIDGLDIIYEQSSLTVEDVEGWWDYLADVGDEISSFASMSWDEIEEMTEAQIEKLVTLNLDLANFTALVSRIGGKLEELANNGDLGGVLTRVLLGDWSDLGDEEISDEMKDMIITVAHITMRAWDYIKDKTAFQIGTIVGVIAFEFFPWAKAVKGAVAVGSRLQKLSAAKIEKLKEAGVTEAIFGWWRRDTAEILTRGWCFAKGTLVATSLGLMPIDEIKAGDLVLSRDVATGHQEYKRVLSTNISASSTFSCVRYSNERGIVEEIRSTEGHPYWVANHSDFAFAKYLRPGDRLSSTTGKEVEVISSHLKRSENGEPLHFYNIDVADYDTYFVGSGVLVHNTDPICARLYMLVSFLKNANWITARGGKLFPKPIHDWQILQYVIVGATAGKKRIKDFTSNTLKELYHKMALLRGEPDGLLTPGTPVTYGEWSLAKTTKLEGTEGHHFWPEEYFLNPGSRNGSLVFEVAESTHTQKNLGYNYVLNTYMIRKLKALGYQFPGSRARDVERAKEIFKSQVPIDGRPALTDPERIKLMRDFYAEEYSIRAPEFGVDGVP